MTTWEEKLDRFRDLKPGWNGYTAPPPSPVAITQARAFLDQLLHARREPSRVAPSAVGGVAITQKTRERKVYVEFLNAGQVLALFSDGVGEPQITQVDPDERGFRKLIEESQSYLA
jgi:hypothetical protein